MIGKTNSKNFYQNIIIKNIPDNYQYVKYLESDGMSYIDTKV